MRKQFYLIISLVALFAFSSCQKSLFSDRSQHHHINKVPVEDSKPEIVAVHLQKNILSELEITSQDVLFSSNEINEQLLNREVSISNKFNTHQDNIVLTSIPHFSLPVFSKVNELTAAQKASASDQASTGPYTILIYFLIFIIILALLSFLIPVFLDIAIWVLVIILLLWLLSFLLSQL